MKWANGSRGWNRINDQRINRPSAIINSFNYQSLAALATPLSSHAKAHFRHSQSRLGTDKCTKENRFPAAHTGRYPVPPLSSLNPQIGSRAAEV